MRVRCSQCELEYDDTYRFTLCPHDHFQMATTVYRPGRPPVIATTIEELHSILEEGPAA